MLQELKPAVDSEVSALAEKLAEAEVARSLLEKQSLSPKVIGAAMGAIGARLREPLTNAAKSVGDWASNPANETLRNALIGAGVGGAVTGASAFKKPPGRRRVLSDAISGALGGALLGGGGTLAAKQFGVRAPLINTQTAAPTPAAQLTVPGGGDPSRGVRDIAGDIERGINTATQGAQEQARQFWNRVNRSLGIGAAGGAAVGATARSNADWQTGAKKLMTDARERIDLLSGSKPEKGAPDLAESVIGSSSPHTRDLTATADALRQGVKPTRAAADIDAAVAWIEDLKQMAKEKKPPTAGLAEAKQDLINYGDIAGTRLSRADRMKLVGRALLPTSKPGGKFNLRPDQARELFIASSPGVRKFLTRAGIGGGAIGAGAYFGPELVDAAIKRLPGPIDLMNGLSPKPTLY